MNNCISHGTMSLKKETSGSIYSEMRSFVINNCATIHLFDLQCFTLKNLTYIKNSVKARIQFGVCTGEN